MSDRRLLVVDDESINLELIREYFADTGFTVDTATDAETAWQMLEQGGAYAAVLLDRMMPGTDGMALLRRIKATPAHAQLPVIMQTAAGSPQLVSEGLAAGAYYYLVKPYARDALLAIVRAALGERTVRDALRAELAAYAGSLRLLRQAEFVFRDIDQAGQLAVALAQICPVPEAAELALGELLVNAVEHGNLAISYQEKSRLRREDGWREEVERRLALPEYAARVVRVTLRNDPEACEISIADQGSGFDWSGYLDLAPERAFDPNGRGIALARIAGGASLDYLGCGNTVRLRFPAGG